ncbi:hypothetical protein O0G97_05480 [Staphylococcus pseudintermedius]|nr:hypothetical protein [Staphylococcus pseudintermedius]MCE5708289.1 hypothetical protein [Staphylococcus pseudintermedius]MDE9873661.1 hypothetical protein [Staphylococcus pseudintermedius]HAR6193227.1 hypothetical protein [Staphylococcus pseudintermedius]
MKKYFEMMLKANEIANKEVRQYSDIDEYDIQFIADKSEFDDPDYIEELKRDYPNVDYNEAFFIVENMEVGYILDILNVSQVHSIDDLLRAVEKDKEYK